MKWMLDFLSLLRVCGFVATHHPPEEIGKAAFFNWVFTGSDESPSWTCPHCGDDSTVKIPRTSQSDFDFQVDASQVRCGRCDGWAMLDSEERHSSPPGRF